MPSGARDASSTTRHRSARITHRAVTPPLDFHVYVLDVDTIMICPDDPTSEDDLIQRGADGMLSLEGWVFHTA